MDSGGFVGDPDPENYARWLQFTRPGADLPRPWRSSQAAAALGAGFDHGRRGRQECHPVPLPAGPVHLRLRPPVLRERRRAGAAAHDGISAGCRLGQRDRPVDVRRLAAGRARAPRANHRGGQPVPEPVDLSAAGSMDRLLPRRPAGGRPQDQVRDQPRRVDRHSAVCPPRGGDLLAGRGALAGQFPSHDDLRRCLPRRNRDRGHVLRR